jgi:hypothetical protein
VVSLRGYAFGAAGHDARRSFLRLALEGHEEREPGALPALKLPRRF